MKITFAVILACMLMNIQAGVNKINSPLYEEWRIRMDKLLESRTISDDVIIGFTSWDIQKIEGWIEYQKLCKSEDALLSGFLLEKLRENQTGDYFLAFVYCFREKIDIQEIIENKCGGNVYLIAEAILKMNPEKKK